MNTNMYKLQAIFKVFDTNQTINFNFPTHCTIAKKNCVCKSLSVLIKTPMRIFYHVKQNTPK